MAEQNKKIFTPDNNKPKKKPEPKQPPMEQPDGFTAANQEPEKETSEPEAQQPAPPDPQEIIRQKQKDIKKSLKGMKKNLEIKLSGKKDEVKISKPNKDTPVSEKKNESWSDKYKKSIDCNNPKGFSQKAHCAGRKKNEETVQEMISRPHVFVGVKDTDPTSNLRPTVSFMPGKSKDFIKIKPVDTNFFNENLKELVNSPYEFLEELGLHTNFGMLIRDKGNEKAMVNAIANRKSFITSGYYGDKVYAVDTNENRLRKTLESSKINEDKKWHYYNLDRGVYRLQKDNNGKIIGKMHDRQKEMRAGFPNADEVLSNTKQASAKVAKLNESAISDKAMMMKLTTKAMKTIANSPEQKEIIKQVNVYRKKLGMKPMKEDISEKAVSKQQQKFFGLVRAIQKGEASGSPEAEKAARDMSKKDVKDFASTKHKGLPKKVQSESELNKRIKELKNKPVKEACWPNFKQVGLKKKGKKMVPNCVPEETNEDVNVASSVFNKAKFVRSFKEMSADKAYRAMDKADKQSRGELSVTDPKKAVKRRIQSKKFADYSIKKTLKNLNKEEFDALHEEALIENEMYNLHEEALQENMHRNLQTFGKELQAYSDKSGGIDKKYFNKIAQTALDGKMPAKSDVDGDTDPRDFVLGMMQRILGKPVMKNYKGISPAFEDNHKEVEKRVKMFKRLRDKKASQGYQKTDLANEGIIKKGWKQGTYHVKDADGKIHGTYKSGKHASKAMHKLMDKGGHKELEVSRADEAYDVKTAKTKYGKITVKSFDSHDDAKSHLASMNKKGHKGIISQDGKPVKEEEVNEISDLKILDAIGKGQKIEKDARGSQRSHGYKKGRQAARLHSKLMDRRDNRELNRHGRFLDKDEPGYRKAGIDKGHKDRAMHMKKMKKNNEEVEIDEAKKSDYELYHKDFSSAMQHAYEVAKKRGYIVDKDDIDNKVATGPRKPSSGKTNRYILGTDKKQNLHVQVANLDNKRYELNMYIEDVQQEDMDPVNKVAVKKKFKDRKDKDIDNDGDVDSSDKYLHKRRKAISKAMAKEEVEKVDEHCGECGADGVNEVESAYAKQIADYKKRGGTVKKYTGPDMKKVKRATAGFKKKLAKTNKIVAQEIEREKAEKEANRANNQEESYTTGSSDNDVLSALKLLSEKGKNQEIKEFANDTIKEYSTQKTFSEENIKRLNYYVNNNPYETDDQSKMVNKLYLMHQAKISNKLKGEERELKISELEKLAEQMGFTQAQYKKIFNKQGLYETKGLNKLNKVMSQRKLDQVEDFNRWIEEEHGAGEEGTTKLVKKYKKDTPGQGEKIEEGNITHDARDPYKIFEKMVHYFLGTSVKDISDFTFTVLDNTRDAIKVEDNRVGAFGVMKLEDAMSFYNNHEMTMEDFTSLLKEFGLSDTGEKDKDDEIIGHVKTKDSFGDNIEFQKEEVETEEKVQITNDEKTVEKEDEVNPIMQKYSDFISFSTKLEKQGFYSNPFNKENDN